MIKKIIRLFIIFYTVLVLIMIIAWTVAHVMSGGNFFSENISKKIVDFAKFPSHIYHTISPNSTPNSIFDERQITDTSSKDGMKFIADYSNFSSTNLLISTFKSTKEIEIKLINVPSGKLIKTWNLSDDPTIKQRYTINEYTRPFHPLMLRDSSIVIKPTDYNMLISINKNNKLNWVDTNRQFHHSTELENDSTIWTSSISKKFSHYKINGFVHDAICSVDPRTGVIKFIKSVADILVENGYQYLLEIGPYENDAIHLNDVQPALTSSKYWKKGDLLISMRHRNTVALYRPTTNKIIWLKTGPWLAQHDCDFVDGKNIMIFGNDVIRGSQDSLINGHNDIYFYNFEKDVVSRPYTKVMKQLGIKTKSEGRCELLTNGDLFIDESNNGKLYIINKDSVKMIYTERYDKNHIKMFNWVRPILN